MNVIELKEIAKQEIDKSNYFIVGAIIFKPDSTYTVNITNSHLTELAKQVIINHIIKSLSLNLNRN